MMSHAMRLVVPVLLAVLTPSTQARAGQGHDTLPHQDFSAPGPEHTTLGALSGTWDVTVMYPIASGRHMEGRATYKGQWVMDGRFIRQTYTSTFAGKPLEIIRYVGFDRHQGKVVEVHFESTHTDVLHAEGAISDDGTTIVCSGVHVDVANGRKSRVRTLTTLIDHQTFTLELAYFDADGRESKTVKLTHRRRKSE